MEIEMTYDMFKENANGLVEQQTRAIWNYCIMLDDKKKAAPLLIFPSHWKAYKNTDKLYRRFHKLLPYDDWNGRAKVPGKGGGYIDRFLYRVMSCYPTIQMDDGSYLVNERRLEA